MTTRKRRGIVAWMIPLVAVVFGLLTIREGGMVLFGEEVAWRVAGHHVPFVL
ncbi:hypothetical protein [Dyella sp. A6]|uniref:hypothetical protein n=1 Tax=Dyella aluminiiresistens TaxID=3069105 RepID=UPI002E75D7CA|nr:hypothetical protein [Dyella sp. A6]